MVIDTGTPTRAFEDLVDSHGDLVDAVKFGWGTALVTRDVKTKIDICRSAGRLMGVIRRGWRID